MEKIKYLSDQGNRKTKRSDINTFNTGIKTDSKIL
jgi:hypothetical protein